MLVKKSANTPSTAATNETAVYQTELAHVVQTAMARVPISTPNPTSTTEPPPTAESSPIATMIPGVTVTSKPTPTDTLEPSATPVWSVRLGNDNPKAYIGREMPPYPPDYPQFTRGLIGEDGAYGMEYYMTQDGSQGLIFLNRLLYHDPLGKAHWQILDAIILNDIPSEERLSKCFTDNNLRDDLVVLNRLDPNDNGRFIIYKIWMADLAKNRLRELNPKSIQCTVPPYGY